MGIFSVGPELWRRFRRMQRERLALALVTGTTAGPTTEYFRLDPYITGRPEEFRRADGAQERVLRWLLATARPVLFLSGSSGSGKSSLLEAYVLPTLEREGWSVEVVRSFGNPLEGLEAALRPRRARGARLLVVFDQSAVRSTQRLPQCDH